MIAVFLADAIPEAAPDGISVETAVLVLLTGAVLYCLHLIGDLRRRVDRLSASLRAKTNPRPAIPVPDTVPPEIVAVIVAAVHETLGPDHHVLAVAPAAIPASDPWSLEGRRTVHSHQFR